MMVNRLFYHNHRKERNIFEAIAVGAAMSVPIITSIAVMMIAFVSVVTLLDTILMWFGSMVDYPQFSFVVRKKM